mgnify:CR=1 FL=1
MKVRIIIAIEGKEGDERYEIEGTKPFIEKAIRLLRKACLALLKK